MSFELFIALRYLFARRKQAFISLISLISMIGVTVGVMALVIALALMTGLQGELRDKILSSQAHIYVWKTGGIPDYAPEVAKLREVPGVVGAAPTIFGKALVTAGAEQAFISVKAIDPVLEPTVTGIKDAMQQGSLDALAHESEDQPPAILIGQDSRNSSRSGSATRSRSSRRRERSRRWACCPARGARASPASTAWASTSSIPPTDSSRCRSASG